MSLAVELFAWCERNPESPIARAVRRPGTEIQRLIATREPTQQQMEVGAAALDAILQAEGSPPVRALPAAAPRRQPLGADPLDEYPPWKPGLSVALDATWVVKRVANSYRGKWTFHK